MLTPDELYWAGLMAEKDRGDLEASVGFYEQALAQSNLAPQLAQQIRRRLDLCAVWLGLK